MSCEKDDFCTKNPVTPNLVIKFMDATNKTSIKKSDSLYVWANGKDSLYKNATLDSIIIPLNTNATETVYNLASGTLKLNTLKFTYEVNGEFVSRSCGYKAIFNNVKITNTSTSSWISELATTEISTINNQANAHVIIYH